MPKRVKRAHDSRADALVARAFSPIYAPRPALAVGDHLRVSLNRFGRFGRKARYPRLTCNDDGVLVVVSAALGVFLRAAAAEKSGNRDQQNADADKQNLFGPDAHLFVLHHR